MGLSLIPILFYTYNGAVGKSPDWLNITIFFVSAAVTFLYETRLFNENRLVCRSPKISIVLLSTIALLFVVFTFITPQIGIFLDPVTGTFGI